jgi:hypothetical protein
VLVARDRVKKIAPDRYQALPVKSFNNMTEMVTVGSYKNVTKRASAFWFW